VLSCVLAAAILIRVVPSFVPGILDLQRCTPDGWQTYNNIALLVEADGVWNSAELDGGTITETHPGVFDYFTLPNGARVRVTVVVSGRREVRAVAAVLSGNVTRLALSNDYGLADSVRTVEGLTANALPEPLDGAGVTGAFYVLTVGPLTMIGNSLVQWQHADGAIEAFAEVRRTPWLRSQPNPGHNWIERVHLTRSGAGEWFFGYSELHRMTVPMIAN
jgi:hypothetical protein